MRYAEYKPTETAWVASIPTAWDCKKISALFSQRKNKVSDKDYPALSVAKIGVVPQLDTAVKTDAGDNRKLVRAGDFVINSRSDRKGSCGVSDFDGSVSLINIVLTPRHEWNSRYVHYLLRCQPFSEEYYHYGRGIVSDLWTTRYSEMKSILLPVPPRKEQDQIVRYLDWQVSKINKLIAAKKKQIALLWESNIAQLYCIMTNGLYPERQMIQTNSRWIRSVPAHWKVTAVRRNYSSVLGKMLASASKNEDDTKEYYFCAKDVHFNIASKGDLKQMWFSSYEKEIYRVVDDDLLIVEGGAGAGGAAMAEISDDEYIYIQNSIHRIRPKNQNASNRFLCYWMHCLQRRGYVEYACNVATIPHFTKEKLLMMEMPFPPYQEQLEIVHYLDIKFAKTKKALNNINKEIEMLHELRTRLTSDVVTGQIDVRSIEVPDFEMVEEANTDEPLDEDEAAGEDEEQEE